MQKTLNRITAIDAFCGAGGLSFGLKKAGIKVKAGFDLDPTCKYPYEKNNKANFICNDIEKISSDELLSNFEDNDIKVIVGCAPCQTFSSHTHKIKNREKDKKWSLINSFLKLIKEVNPDILSMENVPQLQKYEIYKNFVKELESCDYNVTSQIVNCVKYGIPQTRKRLVLLASKYGKIKLIEPTHKKAKTVADTIKYLPPIAQGEAHPDNPLHQSMGLSPLNIKRIKHSIPGGTWRDWPEELILECHKKESGASYSSVYGRMQWEEPAPTITTQYYGLGTGRFGHPEQNRALSLLEGALLQTFPKNYQFYKKGEPFSKSGVGRLIGNAVPVRLGYIIGKSIIKHVKEQNYE